jgi:CubicO group peptidase (beta-lactamase class C family)
MKRAKFLLDDPVSKYIPEFRNPVVLDKFNEKDTTYSTVPAKREITIRDLFTHTSGIDYAGIGSPVMNKIYSKGGIRGGFGGDKITIGDDIKLLGKMPIVHHPEKKWIYGLNVDVIGYLIEILSGEKLMVILKTDYLIRWE